MGSQCYLPPGRVDIHAVPQNPTVPPTPPPSIVRHTNRPSRHQGGIRIVSQSDADCCRVIEAWTECSFKRGPVTNTLLQCIVQAFSDRPLTACCSRIVCSRLGVAPKNVDISPHGHLSPAFEKTCATTPKRVMFLDFEKTLKKVKNARTVSEPT